MRRITWITLLTLLVVGSAGCDRGAGDVAESPSPDVVVAPADATASPEATPVPPPPPGGETTVASGQNVPVPPPPGTLPSELIEPTNANQRLQEVERLQQAQTRRGDPFSTVTVQSRIQPIEQPGGAPAGGAPAGGAPGVRQAPQDTQGGGRAGSRALNPDRLAPIPDLVNGGSGRNGNRSAAAQPPAPPPPPQPTLARAVQVLGVVQIGSVPHAIVQAPNEPTSRYVRVGQRLSNGEVLVKRIEMGPEPIVVLEQVGVEVRTAVGGGQSPATGDASTTALLPLPSVPVN